MPVVKNYNWKDMPEWCELKKYLKITVEPGNPLVLNEPYPKTALVILTGACSVEDNGKVTELTKDYPHNTYKTSADTITITATEKCDIMLMCGTWGEETGGLGIFMVDKIEKPGNFGTAVDYYRNSGFDNHYHDCDEYWIVFQGSGVAYTEGKAFDVSVGDCIVTGTGHHHDFPVANELVLAVFFETTIYGQKRPGHLWEHTHGPAEPQMDRV